MMSVGMKILNSLEYKRLLEAARERDKLRQENEKLKKEKDTLMVIAAANDVVKRWETRD